MVFFFACCCRRMDGLANLQSYDARKIFYVGRRIFYFPPKLLKLQDLLPDRGNG